MAARAATPTRVPPRLEQIWAPNVSYSVTRLLTTPKSQRYLAVIALALAACGSPASTNSGAGGTPHAPGQTGQPSAATSVTVTDDDKGRTVTIAKGGRLTVVLGSLYWTFEGSSAPSVLRPSGQPVIKPGSGCPPGGGCGTVALSFDAVAAGRSEVTASRSSCGEARSCTGDQGAFRITVVVTG